MPKRLITDPLVKWPEGVAPKWVPTPEGYDGGRYGRIEHAVVCKPDGTAIFDRLITVEGPHVITVLYGHDPVDFGMKIGLVKEARDTAAPADGETSLAFWGPPRGFVNEGESVVEAALREAGEEAGAGVIKETHDLGKFITNETTTASWSPFVALEADLSKLQAIAPERGEKIYKAKFFFPEEIEEMIKAGSFEDASTRSMVLIATLSAYRLFSSDF